MDKSKIIRITFEIELGNRKAYLARITEAYDLAVAMAVAAFTDTMPEGSIVKVRTWQERFDLYQRLEEVPYSMEGGETTNEGEPTNVGTV
jgi:hypothetical protein